jgi:hypothetical protein
MPGTTRSRAADALSERVPRFVNGSGPTGLPNLLLRPALSPLRQLRVPLGVTDGDRSTAEASSAAPQPDRPGFRTADAEWVRTARMPKPEHPIPDGESVAPQCTADHARPGPGSRDRHQPPASGPGHRRPDSGYRSPECWRPPVPASYPRRLSRRPTRLVRSEAQASLVVGHFEPERLKLAATGRFGGVVLAG